jgi:N-acetyl-gamma-glutamyl-phosphate reductase
VIDAKSGVSGAGRSPSPGVHFCTVNENLAPYKVAGHRHTPEIEQGLTEVAGRDISVTFTPHLVPMTRGLLATAYLPLDAPLTTADAVQLYEERYAEEPFVYVRAAGHMPGTHEVLASNRAHIGVAVDERTNMLIVACAIDNLIKGSAGQALQCANVVVGSDETAGLDQRSAVV